jgi:hypothetical protein|tara:strand:- start:12286 stop:12522 length:237 start_codon:yes stop_codon:yes gene_type:complete
MTGLKRTRRRITELGKASIGASTLSYVVGGVGGPLAGAGQAGLAGAAGFFPVVGSLAGAGMALDALNPPRGKKRRRSL